MKRSVKIILLKAAAFCCNRLNCVCFLLLGLALGTRADDGHDLWLRKRPARAITVVCAANSPVLTVARQELTLGWQGAVGSKIVLNLTKDREIRDDGFRLRPGNIEARTDAGILYGVYELLRRQQTGQPTAEGVYNPSYKRRMLDHWDNPDGSIERGYAGQSIFWRKTDPFTVTDSDRMRWTEYARADASIGINGAVLNNVNASLLMLSPDYLARLKAIADVLRPYGIRSYMAVRFSSPVQIGGLKTADPLDPGVIEWWSKKAKEIYALIPDFGGFLVKANSEGQPGPQDYGRSHADGANMLADIVKPYGGIILWRAFVYNAADKDRARQAYMEFTPLDGKFHANVIVQVKNGPVDFQPREPFSPLFGGMTKTALAPEFQVTQEYLGQSTHLVFLGPMWEECLKSDTWQRGAGSTVAKCTDGRLFPREYTAIAGVSNVGLDVNWCGHPFAQANWYAFGRLAWNNRLTSAQIADEWLRLTFGPSGNKADWVTNFLRPVKAMMLGSREAAVNYMMPLGLHHQFSANEHYGPGPWWAPKRVRQDWTPPYYHKADSMGIGFERTSTGSNAVSQYNEPLRARFAGLSSCPDIYLLWFHHVAWDYRMRSGRTLWEELCYHYDKGVKEVRGFQTVWDKARPYVDTERFELVQAKLRSQGANAQLWKDACLLYFQRFSNRPIPAGIERPAHDLDDIIREDTTRRFPRRATPASLKETFQNDFLIGTALNIQQIEGRVPRADTLIRRQFNTATPENIMKSALIHPGWDDYQFEPADKLVEYARTNGLRINAHTLIWHSQLPGFVRNIKDADSLRKFFVDHITTVAGRYDGKVQSWDVVNEALNEDGTMRNSIFLQMLGPDYIVEAFRLAQKAAPHTELCYNDYNIESPAKRAGAISIVKSIQAAGVRIDAIGIQGHWHLGKVPFEDIAESIDTFAALGIKVNFTELDISVLPNPLRGNTADVGAGVSGGANGNPWPDGLPDSVQDQLAADYAALFQLFLRHKGQIGRVTFWGVEDGGSWLNGWPVRGRTNYPLLFDRNYAPKKAFYRVIEVATPAVSTAQQGSPAITLRLDQPGHAVPQQLYGLMTEEINFSYDGGLYGELIRNRAFKNNPMAADNWSLVQEGEAKASMALDRHNPLSEALSVSLRLEVQNAGQRAGIANEGYWGIPVKPATSYAVSFFAKGSGSGAITASIESKDGKTIYAKAESPVISGSWQNYKLTLTTPTDCAPTADTRFVLSIKGTGTFWFDLVSVFPPTYNNTPNGNRRDIMELLAGMKPGFLRFPGGNYLEGDYFTSRFDWKKTLGPLEQRPGHPSPWGYRSTDGLGLHEFLMWCEDLKMEPLLAVFAGYTLKGDYFDDPAFLQPFVDEALEEIEYVIGDASTKWGAVRARNGHPAPFPLHYIEIGNEDGFDRSQSYGKRYDQFAAAIRAKYPQLKLISTTGSKRDGLSGRSPLPARFVDVIDEHFYRSSIELQDMATLYDSADRNGPKIFVGEWAGREGFPTTNLNAALGDAAFLTGLERNSDVVIMSCYAPLFVNVNPGGMQWKSDLIGYNTISSFGSPSYYVQKMFSEFLGDQTVPVESRGLPTQVKNPNRQDSAKGIGPRTIPAMFISATKNTRTGMLYVKVVNATGAAQELQVNVQGAGKIVAQGKSVTIGSGAPEDTNSITEPAKVVPVTADEKGFGKQFKHRFPSYSVTVLQVQLAH